MDQMQSRPVLSKGLDSATFREYYYLKKELTEFCRKNGLPASGGKAEIADRIAHFLDSGEISPAKAAARKTSPAYAISESSVIEPNFVCSERHRAFFKERICSSFSFNTAFQKWLKENTGKTYKEAVAAYYQISKDKPKGSTKIGGQFEYNAYIRAFFEDNKGKSLQDAIACWKYKKSISGHNRYEASDLAALSDILPGFGPKN